MSGNLFGWGDAVWLLLERLAVLAGHLVFLFVLGGGLLGFVKRESIRRWFTRNRFPNVGAEMEHEQRWDAIAFVVSHTELPLWVIEFCRPVHIGLIAAESSQAAVLAIAHRARGQGIQVQEPEYVDNPDDPAEALAKTRAVLSRLREAGAKRIAADITGGKTPTSLGAFMAAEESGVTSLYVSYRYDADLNRPDTSTARIHCVSKPE